MQALLTSAKRAEALEIAVFGLASGLVWGINILTISII